MIAIGVIPARYASTRFPGKPLAVIAGKSLIERVYTQAVKADLSKVIVATDDMRIANEVKSFGGNFVLTGGHPSGTDRIAEAVRDEKFDIVVNVQGDEPLIAPEIINTVVKSISDNSPADVSTAAAKIKNPLEITDPNVVKVVFTIKGRALYFSRAAIPFCRTGSREYFKHIGIYGYRKEFLKTFVSLPRSSMEISESLEQLRALENGYHIQVSIVDYDPVSVDTPDDAARVEEIIKNHPK
ncbi:MAG: 3-deoxy-manno-octulosonate cytidylyltransferase [Spirochaetes bacterium]|jgi:3-deoxy-manno-octulosonate cytidylyltransferase (CMP-KDO synthetase)|nr:3-deoxy-manno-octulosonate cytidylyltransferase [Spirochaetota bacterium]